MVKVRTTVNLEQEVFKKLEQIAKNEDRSVSYVVNKYLAQALGIIKKEDNEDE